MPYLGHSPLETASIDLGVRIVELEMPMGLETVWYNSVSSGYRGSLTYLGHTTSETSPIDQCVRVVELETLTFLVLKMVHLRLPFPRFPRIEIVQYEKGASDNI